MCDQAVLTTVNPLDFKRLPGMQVITAANGGRQDKLPTAG